jgi:hypothetical protein
MWTCACKGELGVACERQIVGLIFVRGFIMSVANFCTGE